TGPMMFAKVEDKWPGATFQTTSEAKDYRLNCMVRSEQRLESIDLIVNGSIAQRFEPKNTLLGSGAFESEISTRFKPTGTSWVSWRCFERRPDGRFRFAHTGPWHFEAGDKPLRPRREEAAWLVASVKEEIARSQGIAPEGLIEDYPRAL